VENTKEQHKKLSLESQSGSTKDEKNDEDDKYIKIVTTTESDLKAMKSK